MMAFSLVFIGAVIHLIRDNRAFRHVAVRTHGAVTDRHRYPASRGSRSGGGSGSSYLATLRIRFRAIDGREVIGFAEMGGLGAPKAGSTVQILYDPNDASKVTVGTVLGRATCWHVPVEHRDVDARLRREGRWEREERSLRVPGQ